MCNTTGIVFATVNLTDKDIAGKRILEVGSLDVNGSVRKILKAKGPKEYVGVDIEAGPGVNEVCRVEDLVSRFGNESFDTVVTTELIEHVEDWRTGISNLKAVCKPGGTILVTTRSKGFQYHGFPYDFWRYEIEDMKKIFSDCTIESMESDGLRPGVFVKVTKPLQFIENDLSEVALHSVVVHRRVRTVTEEEKEKFQRSYRQRRLMLGALESLKKVTVRAYHAIAR